MAYYTPEFEREFSNPAQEIRTYIEATNDALRNTGIGGFEGGIKLYVHCFEKIDIMDSSNDDADGRLDQFVSAKGDIDNLLHSADVAMLLTKNGVSTARETE